MTSHKDKIFISIAIILFAAGVGEVCYLGVYNWPSFSEGTDFRDLIITSYLLHIVAVLYFIASVMNVVSRVLYGETDEPS